MTSWLENGRPAILEALTSAFNRIDDGVRTELEQKQLLLDEKLAFITSLEKENARLQVRLDAAGFQAALSGPQTRRHVAKGTSPTPATPVSMSPAPTTSSIPDSMEEFDSLKDWKAEYVTMARKFKAMEQNFKAAKESLRNSKDERDKWIKHSNVLERKIKAAESEHCIHILDRRCQQSRPAPPSTAPPSTCASSGHPSRDSSFSVTDDVAHDDYTLPALPTLPLASTSPDEQARNINPEAQSTQDDAENLEEGLPALPANLAQGYVSVKQEPSSDAPLVVSERPVRKRKLDDTPPRVADARRVKREAAECSSPIFSLERHGFTPQESMDLGDIAQRMLTPRKRKELEASEVHNETSDIALPFATPAPVFVRPHQPPQTARPALKASVLTPISVNRRMVRSGGDKPKTIARKYTLGHGISRLAEDGAEYDEDATPVAKFTNAASSAAKGRLDTLLNSPAPRADSAIRRQVQSTRNPPHASGLDSFIPGRRELPFDKSVRQSDKRLTKETTLTPKVNKADPQRSPQRSPVRGKQNAVSLLRNKPPSELRLEDFRVNPQANEGHDFAFSDVVRNKDDRACLPGCTDMHCCGKQFRALALSQRPDPPLTAAQRQDEQKLLENYLGDYSYKLAMMTKKEKDELWLEAKTKELADKYGTHRHRYARMRSPPGFWNADFPSTQELDADRAEASKRERQLISDRHREAMRPGGRWLFKDE